MPTRRQFLSSSIAASAALKIAIPARAFAEANQSRIDSLVSAYESAYDVPGLSLAYGTQGRIALARGDGLADRHSHEEVTTQSLFRIASLSKAFTSAGIFTLVDAGKLRTSDLIFGKDGILREFTLRAHADWLKAVTVEHLLTHTAGGWSNKEHDPMFREPDRGRATLIQQTLDDYPLQALPGTVYSYSNFGYFLLGRVIERISGVAYGDYVRQHVQTPLGIEDMRLGQRKTAPGEVHYYGQGREDPSTVPIELHDANGGWIATPTDLVRFASGVFSATGSQGAPALL